MAVGLRSRGTNGYASWARSGSRTCSCSSFHDVPSTNRTKELSEALAFLQQARRAFDQGDNDLVASRAFKALEALAPGIPREGVPDRIRDRYLNGLNPVVEERVHDVLIKVTPLMHVGRHATWDAKGRLVDVTRSHAAFLLGATELVVGWCATASK